MNGKISRRSGVMCLTIISTASATSEHVSGRAWDAYRFTSSTMKVSSFSVRAFRASNFGFCDVFQMLCVSETGTGT